MVERTTFGDVEAYVAGGEADEAVVYLSGWREFGVYHRVVPGLVDTFADHGYATIAGPYRGLLGQPGEYSAVSMIDDAVEFAEIVRDHADATRVTAIGNCVGGLGAVGAAESSDAVDRAVTMNTLFALRNDDWWTDQAEYERRTRRWNLIEQGEDGLFGTEFRGMDETFFKETCCRGQDRFAFDERMDEVARNPLMFMTSHIDRRVDPLHTYTMYRYVRNARAAHALESDVKLRVVTREDPDHTLLVTDTELQERVAGWLEDLG